MRLIVCVINLTFAFQGMCFPWFQTSRSLPTNETQHGQAAGNKPKRTTAPHFGESHDIFLLQTTSSLDIDPADLPTRAKR